MEDTALILLIVVSATLSVFLILLGTVAIYALKMLRRAERVADSVESAASAVRRGATAMPFVKLITNVVSRTHNRKKG